MPVMPEQRLYARGNVSQCVSVRNCGGMRNVRGDVKFALVVRIQRVEGLGKWDEII
jgi:hypothetical protein